MFQVRDKNGQLVLSEQEFVETYKKQLQQVGKAIIL